jgi:hypothetical protein
MSCECHLMIHAWRGQALGWLTVCACLASGPIDQPSIHDIVGDFALSMACQQDTENAHRQLINIFRERRPNRHGWDLAHCDDRLSKYVQKYCGHHIEQGWRPDWETDTEATSWLDDCLDSPVLSQDAIPLAAAAFLGPERAGQLARQAESSGEWWLASLRWSALALVTRRYGGHHSALPIFKFAAAALQNVEPTTPHRRLLKERLEIPTYTIILQNWE